MRAESAASVRARIAAFESVLWARPERRIVVVGHSAFLKRWLGHRRKLPNLAFAHLFLRNPDSGRDGGGSGEAMKSAQELATLRALA